jgi:hypothetical protein
VAAKIVNVLRNILACACLTVGLVSAAHSQTLTHRYSFFSTPNGSTTVTDSVAAANGTLKGSASIAGGQLVLNGTSGTYVSLPGGLITGSSAVTIETWATFPSTLPISFLYGFGNTDAGGSGENYIFSTAQLGRIAITGVDPGWQGEQAVQVADWAGQTNLHIVAVYAPASGYIALYTNGILAGINNSVTTQLSSVNNVFSYIGRSLYSSDAYLPASMGEFRIWKGALSQLQVAASDAAGQATVSTNYGTLTNLTFQINSQIMQGSVQQGVALIYASGLANPVNVTQTASYLSGDTNIISVSAGGIVAAGNFGTTTITTSYSGQTNIQSITVVPSATLTHRYSFTNNASDSVGTANGTLQGSATISGGKLVLNGSSGTYLNLPGGIINNYTNVTVEVWATFPASLPTSFLFGFGNTDGSNGANYIFGSAQLGRIAITGVDPGYNGEQGISTGGWAGQTNLHIVAVYAPAAGYVALYTNSILAGINNSVTTPLSAVNDIYSYIGRSLYSGDSYLPASIDEFRIYKGPLSVQQIALDAAAGPDLIVTNPGPVQAIHLMVNNQMPVKGSVQTYSFAPGGTIQSTANLLANGTQQSLVTGDYTNLLGVNLWNYAQPTLVSGNTSVLTVNASGLVTAVGLGTTTLTASYGGLSATQTVTTVIKTNQFIFDSFGDGFWNIINQGNGNALVANVFNTTQAAPATTASNQLYEVLYNLQNQTFRLLQKSSWSCVGSLNGGTAAGTPVATINYSGAPSQQWNLVDAGGGYFRIFNAASGLALQTDNGSPAGVTLAQSNASPYQVWKFNYQAHYPKKGMAGYVEYYAQFGLNWAYNYDDNIQSVLPGGVPGGVNYVPMIYAAQYYQPLGDAQSRNAGWLAQSPPNYLMTYNEPDNSAANGGSNTATNDAIGLWPQIQALNLPLVSPATANTFNSWMYNFYSLIAANNYRVDYTAVHQYVPPNAASLMGQLQSAYNAWGRPVWLTEFSPVDFNNNQGWTEDDDYNFLAEFMWQAEGQDWFKRYSIFPFSGTNPNPPYTSVAAGYRGNYFQSDGSTLTPYGELYATWDGNTTLQTRTPYFIHNLATSFRLSSTNFATPQASTIYVRDATTQWALLPAATSGRYYIISLRDGRRLRNNSGNPILSPVGTVGSTVEWWFNGPDSNGYYYIDNVAASQSIRATGTAPAISFGMINDPAPSTATQWRLVKPYSPVTIVTTAPPTLNITYSNQSATLNWSGNGSFYNVYRSTISGGSYTKIASLVTNVTYLDSTVQNGTAYYYVVTGLNILGEESVYSAEVVARPASTTPQPVGFSLVNNAGQNGIQFNWASDHTGWRLIINTNGLASLNAWFTVPNSAATNQIWLPFDPAQTSVFFQLIYP